MHIPICIIYCVSSTRIHVQASFMEPAICNGGNFKGTLGTVLMDETRFFNQVPSYT